MPAAASLVVGPTATNAERHETVGDRPSSGREAPSVELRAGDTIGQYIVRRKLGAGAMGEVWLAHDPVLERDVAVKIIPARIAQDAERRKRFLREAKLAARLTHTNVVAVYQAAVEEDRVFIAMELVDGQSLEQVIAASGRLPWRDATRMVLDAAQGLAAAHELGLVHRDIKPANLMRTQRGVTKVVDFGLARGQVTDTQFTQQGAVLGTPAYMAPEQWTAGEVDGRADLYALTCTYFHLLCGRLPFDAPNFAALGYQHRYEPIPDPRALASDLPDGVCRVLARGSQKDPQARQQTAAELVADLKSLLEAADESLSRSTTWEVIRDEKASFPRIPVESGINDRMPNRRITIRHPAVWLAIPTVLAVLLLGIYLGSPDSMGHVRIELSEPSAEVEVSVDGTVIEPVVRMGAIELRPGEHELLVSGNDFETFSRSFLVRPGEERVLNAVLIPLATADPGPGTPEPELASAAAAPAPPAAAPADPQPVAATTPPPSFRLLPIPDMTVRAGQRSTFDIRVARSNYSGPISLQLDGLPEGVTMTPATIPVDQDTVTLELSAVFEVSAAEEEVRLLAVNGDTFDAGLVKLLVVKAPAFRLQKIKDVALKQGHAGGVEIRVQRNGERGALRVRIEGLPPNVNAYAESEKVSETTIADGSDRAHLQLRTPLDAQPTEAIARVIVERDGDLIEGAVKIAVVPAGDFRRFLGHKLHVDALALSADGSRMLSATTYNDDARVRLWNVETGQEIRGYPIESGVGSIAFAPGDSRAMFCGDEVMALLDLETGRELRRFDHESRIWSVAFSPDGRQAISGSGYEDFSKVTSGNNKVFKDCFVRLWNVGTGSEIRRFEGHASTVTTVAFSPTMPEIVSGGDKTVRLWNLESGEEIRHFSGHKDYIKRVVFSPDGSQILTASDRVRLYETATGKMVRRFEDDQFGLQAVAISPDGERVLTGGLDALRLFDVSTGRKLAEFDGHTGYILDAIFSPDGRSAFSASSDATVRMWELPD